MKTIRTGYDGQNIYVDFDKRGENFILEVPHKQKWIELMQFLKKRGWLIKPDKYIAKSIRQTYKLGTKKDLFLTIELLPSQINISVDLKINLFPNSSHIRPIWHHDNYIKHNYMQHCAVALEKYKMIELFKSWGHEFQKNDSDMSPVEYILNKEKVNPHIHGGAKTLLEIKEYITEDSYNYKYNSNDKNGKKIMCGDKKYFYYRGRLSCGIVWHNINNMWWVLYGKEFTNEADFRLFDFNKSLSRKGPISKDKLENMIDKFSKERNFIKCQAIYNHGVSIGILNK